ncbi:nitroreductase family deazaflavin-dependent oxidoreductase [Microlunatus soli]|uniref:Deazaflavin-dependent oxidoreductase, nitroreductase family n=1 Tax=Microlunatus soli TaxID=630515 RepID=A0A1H1Q450_9ACTN|nr:nitroreductase family deazaflavin-dependent oxidoreductase [Microlunatus soli]SDS18205.1 deazaflavin-dependent oxidoreductase, nitroreductase family [Microlunatus soli]
MRWRTRLAIKIGSVPWMPRLLPLIVRCDNAVQTVTGQRCGLLDIAGLPNVTLLTTGRRSGVRRVTRLLAAPTGSGWLIAGSYFGGPRTPQWVFNLRAVDRAAVVDHGRRIAVVVSELGGDERHAGWQRLRAVWPNFSLYERRTDRQIPVFELVRD